MVSGLGITNQLEHHLKKSLEVFRAAGDGPDNKDDLSFMEMVYEVDEQLLPFKHLLSVLNNTYLNGYAEIDEM